MSLRYDTLAKSQIKASPFVFRFGVAGDAALSESIKKNGLLTPLLVWKRGGDYCLLDGAQRLQHLISDTIPVSIFESDQIQDAFLLTLESNSWHRTFNIIEAAYLLRQSVELSCEEIILSKLSIKNIHLKKDYLSLLTLPLEIQNAALKNLWPLHVAVKWCDVMASDRSALFQKLNTLTFNQNKWGEILTWIVEVVRRDRSCALALVNELLLSLESISDSMQRSQLFRDELEKKRSPRLKSQQDKFAHALYQAKLPKGTQVEASPYFDNREIFVRAKITSQADVEKLKLCLDESLIKELLDVMG